jgi:hypothetical protein
MNAFLVYFMKHAVKNDVNSIYPVFDIMDSLCVDYYYFLTILECYMVDEFDAKREDARKYLKKEFFTYYHMFFLVVGIFKLNYSILSMKINELTFSRKSTGNEVIKSWIPAIYKDENDVIFYVRQIQFSKSCIEERIQEIEKNKVSSVLNFRVYSDFLPHLKRQKIEQLSWAKDANVAIKRKDLKMSLNGFGNLVSIYNVSLRACNLISRMCNLITVRKI